MSQSLSHLLKDTAWYGLSTIAGRLLNWLLVPFYVRVLQSTGEYGVVTNLYAWTALLLVLLTYGMETGFFYFVNGHEKPNQVYRTALRSLFVTSTLFALAIALFSEPISKTLLGVSMPSLVVMMGLIIASDAFMAMPYAYLRYKKKSKRFATIKLTFVLANIGLNLFFLLLCPWLLRLGYERAIWFYRPGMGVFYIILSNLLANAVVLALLIPAMRPAFRGEGASFSGALLKAMLRYSLPLVLLGIAGIFNQMADKILFPFLYSSREVAMAELGIYGACFKIAVIMVLFTQAFRYAFEPFFFEKSEGKDGEQVKKQQLATATKYFWLFLLVTFLAVMGYINLLKFFVVPAYYSGLAIVPWVMWGEMMMGIALNLSTWYKLTKRTSFGALVSIGGGLVGVLLIVWGVPRYGFIAAAWAVAISNTIIVLISYFLGQKYYPIPYQLRHAGGYLIVAMAGYLLISISNRYASTLGWWHLLINTAIILLFILLIIVREEPVRRSLQALKNGS